MQLSTKPLVVLGLVASFWLGGCSSKPTGGQPSTGIPSTTQTVSEITTSRDSTYETSGTAEVGTSKKSDDGVGSKITPPIIGQLKSRHHMTLIHTSTDGPRFTVSTLDGKVIAAALSIEEMQAQHPEIYKLYKETFATRDGTLDASNYLDAGSPDLRAPTGSR